MLLASINTYLTLPSGSLGKAPASQAEGTDFESSLGTTFFFALIDNIHCTRISKNEELKINYRKLKRKK